MAQEMVAPGFRFNPTDEELLSCYLLRKPIAEIELYKSEQSELLALSPLKSKDMLWFFFNAVDRKHGSGYSSRIKRATHQQGYWKSTGKDCPVKNMSKTIIGMKKTLAFHDRRAPDGKRTDWVIHEYRLRVDEQLEYAFVAQVHGLNLLPYLFNPNIMVCRQAFINYICWKNYFDLHLSPFDLAQLWS